MFENPRRGRQARNFTINVPKILDLQSSAQQIFFWKLTLGAPVTGLFDCRLQPAGYPAGLILVTRHAMRSVNGSTSVWKSPVRNSEADRATDKSIASQRSVEGIANRVNEHENANSLLWIAGGIEAGGNFPAELFASSDGHSGNHCSALSFS